MGKTLTGKLPYKTRLWQRNSKRSPSVSTCVKPSQVPTLPPRKRSTVKELAEVRNLFSDESDDVLAKDKIRDFQIFHLR